MVEIISFYPLVSAPKIFQKKVKKGVDKTPIWVYYKQARSRATNLENDTERRNARTTVNKLE